MTNIHLKKQDKSDSIFLSQASAESQREEAMLRSLEFDPSIFYTNEEVMIQSYLLDSSVHNGTSMMFEPDVLQPDNTRQRQLSWDLLSQSPPGPNEHLDDDLSVISSISDVDEEEHQQHANGAVFGDPSAAYQHNIRQFIVQRFDTASKKAVALYEYFRNDWRKSPGQACCLAASLVGTVAEQVEDWVTEFEETHEVMPPDPSEYQQQAELKPCRINKRTWLLEEYPELLKRAQLWVNEMMTQSVEAEGKLFRITEFQRWVNVDLLVPLYENSGNKQVTPISHSTARSWLNRLGYYEEMKRLENDSGIVSHNHGYTTAAASAMDKKLIRERARTFQQRKNSINSSIAESLPETPVRRTRSNTWSAATSNFGNNTGETSVMDE